MAALSNGMTYAVASKMMSDNMINFIDIKFIYVSNKETHHHNILNNNNILYISYRYN